MVPNAKEGPWTLHIELEYSECSSDGLGHPFSLREVMVMLQAHHLKGVSVWPPLHTPANKSKKNSTLSVHFPSFYLKVSTSLKCPFLTF